MAMELLIHPAERAAERGVTLIETLAAVLILSLVAISVLSMFSQGMMLNATGSDYTLLTNEARHKAEELMALEYTDADLAQTDPGTPHSVVVYEPHELTIIWQVGEHLLVQGNEDPATVIGTDPLQSSVATNNSGNLKVIAVTVVTGSLAGLGGQRNVTVQTIKLSESI